MTEQNSIDALLQQAATLHQKGRLSEAVKAYTVLLAKAPKDWKGCADTWNNMGVALRALGRARAAISCYQRAIAIRPDHGGTYSNMGNALRDLARYQQSAAAHQKAVQLAPDSLDATYNLGLVMRDLGEMETALECFDKTLAAKPDHVDCLWDQALTTLVTGNMEKGFPQYEERWRLSYNKPRGYAQPLWDGGDLTGKTILLHHEQGFGDTLQFIRFCPIVKAKGGRVIVECQPELARLFESVDGIDELVPSGQKLPSFDVYAPLLSLGSILKVTEATIPHTIPYLRAPSAPGSAIAAEVAARTEPFKIGISWAGKPSHRNDRNRSASFEPFMDLTDIADTHFYSLQKGDRVQDMAKQGAPALVSELGSRLGDFAETAAVMEQLDLIITVDTAVAHLAGALGRPVWVLVPFSPDWRWMLDRDDSPWYPTMRLYRQTDPGEWDGVFARVHKNLGQWVTSSAPSA